MLSIVRLLVVLLVASSGLHASRAAPKTPVREIPRNGGMLLPLAWSAAGASGALPLPAGANRTTSLDGYWNFVTDPSGNLKVGDLASASNFDAITVDGALSLGGALNVQLLNGYQPQPGDQWIIGSASSINARQRS